MAKLPPNVDAFSPFVLKPPTLGLLEENARLASENAALREEIARLKGRNGFCPQIGNDAFAFFATTASKSRANVLGLLRAGHGDYALNDQAFAYMRRRHLAGPVIARLSAHPARAFADRAAWEAHLAALGIAALKVR